MFGTVLKFIPVLLAPLVEMLAAKLKGRTKNDAQEIIGMGGAYMRAYADNDMELMKLLHASAMARAKFLALDAVEKK